MTLTDLFSVLITIFSFGLTFLGLPAQIVKNNRERRSGQPLLTILIALGFYITQICFFFLIKSYLPIVSFGFGFLLWGVIGWQYWLFRTPHKR